MKDNRRKYMRDEQTQIRSIEREKEKDDRKRSDESETST